MYLRTKKFLSQVVLITSPSYYEPPLLITYTLTSSAIAEDSFNGYQGVLDPRKPHKGEKWIPFQTGKRVGRGV
jgi:hypothetical protein